MIVSLLLKSVVKPFYRQNGGLIGFLYFILVFVVGRANEVGLLEYHFSLIKIMLHDKIVLLIVMAGWLFYARKCFQFFYSTIRNPEFSYLYLLGQLNTVQAYALLLLAQFLLYLPMSAYIAVALLVGYLHHWYLGSTIVLLFNMGILSGAAYGYLILIQNPKSSKAIASWKIPRLLRQPRYFRFLVDYVLSRRKILFLVLKLSGCAVIYFIFAHRLPVEKDMSMAILAFSVVMLGQGVLIHQVKEMENAGLDFYPGLPVTVFQRFLQYLLFYLLFFSPEILTIETQLPGFMSVWTGVFFIVLGYGILILLHGILLIRFVRMVDYLKILTGIFLVIFFAVASGNAEWLLIPIYSIGICLFFFLYYRQERYA